jgi:glycine C-acetyltransferase
VLELLEHSAAPREQLRANATFFREGLTRLGFELLPGEHPIVPVLFGEAGRATRFAEALLELGVYVIAFSYPVVPEGRARIRCQLSAAHTQADLSFALDAFAQARSRAQ